MKEPWYSPADFYMLRAPALPAEIIRRISGIPTEDREFDTRTLTPEVIESVRSNTRAILDELLADPIIAQAIAVASDDLSGEVDRVRRGDRAGRRVDRAYASILRYLVRMSSRPTPFGTFAGVSVGPVGEKTSVKLRSPAVSSFRVRPDMAWLLAVVELVESQSTIRSQLRVMANRTIQIVGERAIIPSADVYGKGDDRSISVRATGVVRHALSRAEQPVKYGELRQDVRETFATATDGQIDGLLDKLWELGYLISDLRPPLTSAEPEQHLLARLRGAPAAAAVADQLAAVVAAARDVEAGGVGGSTELLRVMAERQRTLVNTDSRQMQQVDARLNVLTPTLATSVVETAAETADVLLRLAPVRSPSGLDEYHTAFLERYGLDAEVPLLDLLSPEIGLDAPNGYLNPPRAFPMPPTPPPDTRSRDGVLADILAEALVRGDVEIELTDTLVSRLTPDDEPARRLRAPSIAEMYVQLQAKSTQALEDGDFRIAVAPMQMTYGGRTFCRFFDLLDDETVRRLREYMTEEERAFPDVIFAELAYLPASGRGANVAIRPMIYSHEIAVNTTPSVSPDDVILLQDITVGATGDRFYLRSVKDGREVVVSQSHMLSPMRAPNACRFMLQVSQQRYAMPYMFDWGVIGQASYLPRVVRGRAVLSPAQWRISGEMLGPAALDGDEVDFIREVRLWREKWRAPRWVYLVEFDNRLLLDLEQPMLLDELRKRLTGKPRDSVRLQEVLPNLDELWLRDDEDRAYFAELVLPLRVRTTADNSHKAALSARPGRVVALHDRIAFPGNRWTYVKLYAATTKYDALIAGQIGELVDRLEDENLIDRWFFLRYADPDPHLRLRVHAIDEASSDEVLVRTLAWSRGLAQSGIISNMAVEPYAREVERYGGPGAIAAMEQVFHANSVVVRDLISAAIAKKIDLDPLVVAVLTYDRLAASWGWDADRRLASLRRTTDEHDQRKEFRSHRRTLCELLSPWDTDFDPAIRDMGTRISDICSTQEHALRAAANTVADLSTRNELWNDEEDIVSSLLHMHANRLLGLNLHQERTSRSFWRHSLEALQRRPDHK